MKEKMIKRLGPALFAISGALAGLAYYSHVGCSSGSCPLASHPFVPMAYTGAINRETLEKGISMITVQ